MWALLRDTLELLKPALELVETLDECAGQGYPEIVGPRGR